MSKEVRITVGESSNVFASIDRGDLRRCSKREEIEMDREKIKIRHGVLVRRVDFGYDNVR